MNKNQTIKNYCSNAVNTADKLQRCRGGFGKLWTELFGGFH